MSRIKQKYYIYMNTCGFVCTRHLSVTAALLIHFSTTYITNKCQLDYMVIIIVSLIANESAN